MKIDEVRTLLDRLEQIDPDLACRLTIPYSEDLRLDDYLWALEQSAWGEREAVIVEKK